MILLNNDINRSHCIGFCVRAFAFHSRFYIEIVIRSKLKQGAHFLLLETDNQRYTDVRVPFGSQFFKKFLKL